MEESRKDKRVTKEYKVTETRKGKNEEKAGLVNDIRCNIAVKEDEE